MSDMPRASCAIARTMDSAARVRQHLAQDAAVIFSR